MQHQILSKLNGQRWKELIQSHFNLGVQTRYQYCAKLQHLRGRMYDLELKQKYGKDCTWSDERIVNVGQ